MQLIRSCYERLLIVKNEGSFSLYEYKPTIIRPLLVPFEPLRMIADCVFGKKCYRAVIEFIILQIMIRFLVTV